MSIEAIYTAESTASGGGRDGHVKSSDGRVDLATRPPKPGQQSPPRRPYFNATRGSVDVGVSAKG